MLFFRKKSQLDKRLQHLEAYLQQENPLLVTVMKSYRELDRVAHRLGFFDDEESYTRFVPWWPIISVLGTYSSGKSTFINEYIGYKLQMTGNQAVDDKFTVICYSNDNTVHVLPGTALDADPRFPFYRISREIDQVAAGEGQRIDAYLQLKTCPSEVLRGKIFIDSPGFDADEQRSAILRSTSYIIDLSDLVLVFFDARHPESGTMRDTLRHLVEETIHRKDSNKFLYILNQLDVAAREDNAEDVVASWERALAQKGLTAGRFFRIFSKSAAIPIEDPNIRARYEAKRDADMADIDARIQDVSKERAYRIVGALEQHARDVQEKLIPRLRSLLHSWRVRVLWLDSIVFAVIALLIGFVLWNGGADFVASFPEDQQLWIWGIGLALLLLVLGYIHFSIRRRVARAIITKMRRDMQGEEFLENFIKAFEYNTRPSRSVMQKDPAGWGQRTQDAIQKIVNEAADFIQKLNDAFANPSGRQAR